ncbi:MAG: CvpA family protein [Phycisphaeraceae bacterium]|nr:CvpA family protein [Phycisphaerales bacterium]MCB9861142.1 CvpA family protein [Phycisphaeraceae bacterium]
MGFLGVALPLAVVLFSLLMWMNRGFFSAAIHLVCTIVAGAIAFAFWEPLSLMLLDKSPQTGFASVLRDVAWGVSLSSVFVVSLVVLRGAVDSIVRRNANVSDQANTIGGTLCGIGSGIIASGIMTLSIGSLRLGSDWPTTVTYNDLDARGSIVFNSGIMKPWTDELTAKFYGIASAGAFKPVIGGDSLARSYPEGVHVVPSSLRVSFEGGNGRNTLKRGDLTLRKDFSYVVGDVTNGTPMGQLLNTDKWVSSQHKAVRLNGEEITRGYLIGVAIDFGPGAKETGGGSQVQMTNAQVRLVAEDENGESRSYFPVACFSASSGSSTGRVGRWRFDQGDLDNPMVITSVGGSSNTPFTFEFAVDAGFLPHAIFVKNVRVDISNTMQELPSDRVFAAVSTDKGRDRWISTMYDPSDTDSTIAGENAVAVREIMIRPQNETRANRGELLQDIGITIRNSIGFIIKKGVEGSLQVSSDAGKMDIVNGEQKFSSEQLKTVGVIEKSLRIGTFQESDGVRVVQMDVSVGSRLDLLGPYFEGVNRNQPIRLVDENGTAYDAIGFIYRDQAALTHIRFTPSIPLKSINDIPSRPSITNPDGKLTIIFRVSRGVNIRFLQVGDFTIMDFSQAPWPV